MDAGVALIVVAHTNLVNTKLLLQSVDQYDCPPLKQVIYNVLQAKRVEMVSAVSDDVNVRRICMNMCHYARDHLLLACDDLTGYVAAIYKHVMYKRFDTIAVLQADEVGVTGEMIDDLVKQFAEFPRGDFAVLSSSMPVKYAVPNVPVRRKDFVLNDPSVVKLHTGPYGMTIGDEMPGHEPITRKWDPNAKRLINCAVFSSDFLDWFQSLEEYGDEQGPGMELARATAQGCRCRVVNVQGYVPRVDSEDSFREFVKHERKRKQHCSKAADDQYRKDGSPGHAGESVGDDMRDVSFSTVVGAFSGG